MGRIILPSARWTTKPPFPAVLNKNHPLSKGLVGLWLFNEGAGLTAFDLSGNRNNGTLTNGPTWNAGKFGGAVSLDGSNDYIQPGSIGGFGTFVGQGNFTVSTWVKTNSANTRQAIITDHDSGAGNNSLSLEFGGYNQPSDHIMVAMTGSSYLDSNYVYSSGTWYLVTVTHDAGVDKIYVNGALRNQRASGAILAGGTLTFGRFGAYNGGYLNGSLDNVRIYNRALSDSEVKQLYIEPFAGLSQPKRVIYFDVAAGGATHASSGSLSNAGASVVGTAGHLLLHTASGVLANSGAAIVGTGTRQHPHATSGSLSPTGASIAGTSAKEHPHAASGVLAPSGAAIVGTSAKEHPHTTSGVLANAGASIAGTAAKEHAHASSGVLGNTGAAIVGSGEVTPHTNTHASSGALQPAGASIAGTSGHLILHSASGALSGAGAVVDGVALRYAIHTSSGVLSGANAIVVGTVAVSGILSLTQADIDAIANAVWAHPKALTVAKFLGLK